MKRRYYIVLAGLGLVGFVYVYLHRQEIGLAGPPHSGTGDSSAFFARPPRITWQPVNRPSDGFKVEMPSDVKEIEIPAYNEYGGTDQVKMLFSNPSSDVTFSVAWADNPPVVRVNMRSPEHMLDMARDSALARTETTLVSETHIVPAGMPGRDFIAKNTGGGVMDTRLIIAGERLYMLTVAFPSLDSRREQDVLRFFNSFTTATTSSVPQSLPAAPAPR